MVLVLAVGGFLFFVIANEEMRILFYTRFFGGDDISTEFENAFFIGRSLNYEQYYSKFIASFPFGQGLGHPLSVTLLEDEIYTSDISIVSFVLPLGVFGILLLIGYLKVVLKFFSAFRREFPSSKAPKVYVLMIFVTLFASLNVDMYSRNIFVVYLAYFASLHFQSTRMDRNAINFARINND